MGQQYVQIYGVPGTANRTVYPYGQVGQPLPSGLGYTPIQSYAVPNHHIMQLTGLSDGTAAPQPTIQSSYPTGAVAPVPAQPQFMVPSQSPQFTQHSGSDQTAG